MVKRSSSDNTTNGVKRRRTSSSGKRTSSSRSGATVDLAPLSQQEHEDVEEVEVEVVEGNDSSPIIIRRSTTPPFDDDIEHLASPPFDEPILMDSDKDDDDIEEVDVDDDDDVLILEPASQPTNLNARKGLKNNCCSICLDEFDKVAVTPCGK